MRLPIMTFNIQHGVDYKKRLAEPDRYSDFELIDLPLMAAAIRDLGAVIVGLNEVRDVLPDVNDPCFVPQAKALAEAAGFEYYQRLFVILLYASDCLLVHLYLSFVPLV